MIRSLAVVGLVLVLPASAPAQSHGRPVEPFHLQPIAPASGVLFELRPTVFEAQDDTNFGLGWLFEGRLAFLDRMVYASLAFPLGMGFVQSDAPSAGAVALGNVEAGGGFGQDLARGGRWGFGGRIALPTSGDSWPPAVAGVAGRPYDWQLHALSAADARAFIHVGIDDGGFVGQLETGLDFQIPDDTSNELLARFGFLVGYHLAARTILMMEMTWRDYLTQTADGQISFQPGLRFPASVLDLACYLTVPVDEPLGGHAFAFGFQALWNP